MSLTRLDLDDSDIRRESRLAAEYYGLTPSQQAERDAQAESQKRAIKADAEFDAFAERFFETADASTFAPADNRTTEEVLDRAIANLACTMAQLKDARKTLAAMKTVVYSSFTGASDAVAMDAMLAKMEHDVRLLAIEYAW